MVYKKLFESDISCEAAKAWRAEGKKALGFICCHIPEEILYAAGVLPVRMRATGCVDSSEAETWMSSFSCSFAKSILQYWLDGTYDGLDGFVASDGCLMAARVYDNAKYINERQNQGKFLRQIGAPRLSNKRNVEFYVAELKDLIANLEEFTGNKITDEKLNEAIAKYNERRALIKKVNELRLADKPVITGAEALQLTLSASNYSVDEYNEMLKAFLADAGNRQPVEGTRARLMVIGSALDNPEYLKVIEDKGGLFVCDTLCFGTMGYGEELKVEGDIIESIAAYYLKRLVCPRMMDKHIEMHDYIVKTAKEYNVDGIIYERMQNCECWGGENVLLERRLKDAGIPLLTVEREEQMANAGQLAIRAEAFIEMIEK